jgi:hypothetical protein
MLEHKKSIKNKIDLIIKERKIIKYKQFCANIIKICNELGHILKKNIKYLSKVIIKKYYNTVSLTRTS